MKCNKWKSAPGPQNNNKLEHMEMDNGLRSPDKKTRESLSPWIEVEMALLLDLWTLGN